MCVFACQPYLKAQRSGRLCLRTQTPGWVTPWSSAGKEKHTSEQRPTPNADRRCPNSHVVNKEQKHTAGFTHSHLVLTLSATRRPHLPFRQLRLFCARLRSEWLMNRFKNGCKCAGKRCGEAHRVQPRPVALRGRIVVFKFAGCLQTCVILCLPLHVSLNAC